MSVIKQNTTDIDLDSHDPTSGLALLKLLMTQHRILERVEAMTDQQSQLIAEDRISSLLELLVEKQRVIEELSMVQTQLMPFYQIDASQRTWPDARTRSAAQSAASLCNDLLQRIAERESLDQEALSLNRDRLAVQLNSFHQAAGAYRAYQEANVQPQSEHDFGLS